jgi:hypothetical protein
MAINKEQSAQLLVNFPADKILQNRGMDYVSHSTVTRRLIEVDPNYTVKTVKNNNGEPIVIIDPLSGIPVTMLVELTVLGVTYEGWGTYDAPLPKEDRNKYLTGELKWSYARDTDCYKKMFSDGLKIAAMRCGVALSLWDKTEINDAETVENKERDALYIKVRERVMTNSVVYAEVVKTVGAGKKLSECTLEELTEIQKQIS